MSQPRAGRAPWAVAGRPLPGPVAEPDDLSLALALADRADRLTLAAFRRADLVVDTKPDLTPVTEADRDTEAALRVLLSAAHPGDAVLGEEHGSTGSGDRRWIIDPIDGTKNFVRGIPVFASLLALEVDGHLTVGVASAPALGRRWWAGRGLGAFAGPCGVAGGLAGTAIRVSGIGELADAQISSGGIEGWDTRGGPERLAALTRRCWRDRGFGDFWSHVLVAEGACEIGLDAVASLWDLAAVRVIVEEAGGCFTDFDGRLTAGGGSGISTNGRLHDLVLAALRPGSAGCDRDTAS